MTITPDSKDWTWVLDRACGECGFDASSVKVAQVPELIRTNASMWDPVLSRPDVRERYVEDKWSPLEYACHVRDVYRLYDHRVLLMLETDNPMFPNWDQDAYAISERYDAQDPMTVLSELQSAARQIADRFAGLREDQWERTGTRSDGAEFTVHSLSRYMVHDPIHHLWDVG